MFGPHHSRTSLKILAFIFSWKKKKKNPPSEKGAVNACYILHCSERSVIASSFWEMHCRKLVPRLYQESSTSFSNTELILSEMVLVKLSTTLSSADASSQIAFFFFLFFSSTVYSRTYIILPRHLYYSFIMQWEKLSHYTVHSDLLQQELLEEVWTSVVCAALVCPRRQSQSQRQEPSWWDLGQPLPSWGPRGCSLNSLLRVRHLWQCSRRYHRLPPV